MKQIKKFEGRIQNDVIAEVNAALKKLSNSEVVAVTMRDRKMNFYVQYDA